MKLDEKTSTIFKYAYFVCNKEIPTKEEEGKKHPDDVHKVLRDFKVGLLKDIEMIFQVWLAHDRPDDEDTPVVSFEKFNSSRYGSEKDIVFLGNKIYKLFSNCTIRLNKSTEEMEIIAEDLVTLPDLIIYDIKFTDLELSILALRYGVKEHAVSPPPSKRCLAFHFKDNSNTLVIDKKDYRLSPTQAKIIKYMANEYLTKGKVDIARSILLQVARRKIGELPDDDDILKNYFKHNKGGLAVRKILFSKGTNKTISFKEKYRK
ncbi:MAG: hypothetical protein HQK86_02520 [Nitrospinae bacterium]|nr:hypothetical protein [Nitrospinota bacterium]